MSRIELKYKPTNLVVDQTIVCNQECSFCWRADRSRVAAVAREAPWKVMPLEVYRRIVEAAAEVETMRFMSLCGPMGEPTLVPDLCERGRIAKATGRYTAGININTNGYALDRYDPDELMASFTDVCVSLDAADAETHAAIHGKTGQFETIVANVERLSAARQRLGAESGALRVRFTEGAVNRGSFEALERMLAGRVDSLMHMREHSFIDTLPQYWDTVGATLCAQPWRAINFNYRGELTTCCINHHLEPTFGTLDDAPLAELWEGEAFETWRKQRMSGICAGCSGLGPQAQLPGDGQRALMEARAAMISDMGEWNYYTYAR